MMARVALVDLLRYSYETGGYVSAEEAVLEYGEEGLRHPEAVRARQEVV